MNSQQIVATLKQLLSERFSVDPAKIDGETRLGEIGIDSLHVVDLMLDLESELGFNFDSLDLPPNPSVTEISSAIVKNKK